MKLAFTMIELIFIIFIIGILAAIAIPKLAATRGDAEAVLISNQLAVCVSDAGGAYLKTNLFIGVSGGGADALPLGSPACQDVQLSTKNGELCYNVTVSDTSGTISVTEVGTSTICSKAYLVSEENGISLSGGTKVIHF